MSPLSSSSSKLASAFVLVALVAVTLATPTFAAAASSSKTKSSMPPACLRVATALCTGSSTNAMSCLKKLAKEGDSRVSQACTLALAEQATPSKPTAATRIKKMGRLLTEGGGKCATTKTVTASGSDYVRATGTCGGVCCNSPNNNACCLTLGFSTSVWCSGSQFCR